MKTVLCTPLQLVHKLDLTGYGMQEVEDKLP